MNVIELLKRMAEDLPHAVAVQAGLESRIPLEPAGFQRQLDVHVIRGQAGVQGRRDGVHVGCAAPG